MICIDYGPSVAFTYQVITGCCFDMLMIYFAISSYETSCVLQMTMSVLVTMAAVNTFALTEMGVIRVNVTMDMNLLVAAS